MAKDDRISKFVLAITKEAEEQRYLIEQETKAFVDGEMKKAEDDALHESFNLIQHAAANIRSDAGSKISTGKNEYRKKLLLRREEIIAEVLEAVCEKLTAYTKSADYASFLERSAENAAELFGEGRTAYLRPADMKYADRIASMGFEVKADESIRLGGLKFGDSLGFKSADDTFDCRLKVGREWFMKNSGLTVAVR